MRHLIIVALSLLIVGACSNNGVSTSGSQRSHVLNNELSELSFMSVKNNTIGETHRFTSLSGFVAEGEQAQVQINLASVDTGIPIRNERMREHLFKIAQFATANIAVPLGDHRTQQLRKGQALSRDISLTLDLHGETQTLSARVNVTRLADGGLLVQSLAPVTLNPASFDMNAGVDKLRELAGLTSIGRVVPVSFSLRFEPA